MYSIQHYSLLGLNIHVYQCTPQYRSNSYVYYGGVAYIALVQTNSDVHGVQICPCRQHY